LQNSFDITILTVNYNTSHFIKLMIYSFCVLTKRKWKMIICDNGSKESDFAKLKEIISSHKNIELITRQQKNEQPSIAHGKAMDLLISKVDTPYFLLMDADCVFLRKFWDDDIIDQMQKDNLTLIGTPSVFNSYKPIDFPEVYATMFDTQKYKELGSPSLCPDEVWANSNDKNNIEARDTGWLVRRECIKKGHNYYVFDAIYTKHNYIKSKNFSGIYCLEFFMRATDEIICSHFGRGSSQGAWKFADKKTFLPKAFLKRNQLNNWIKKSKKIIAKQAALKKPKDLIVIT
jgi:glycosyltransferase involved in cell wall biosynthesis